MKRTDLAYLAGILDGEGSIQIRKRKDRGMRRGFCYQLSISIANTNEWLVNWIHFNFEGGIYRKPSLLPHHKQAYLWQATSKQAEVVLKLLLPYLRLKKPQAEIALQFQSRKIHNSGGKFKSSGAFAVEEAQRILIQSHNDNRRGTIKYFKEAGL